MSMESAQRRFGGVGKQQRRRFFFYQVVAHNYRKLRRRNQCRKISCCHYRLTTNDKTRSRAAAKSKSKITFCANNITLTSFRCLRCCHQYLTFFFENWIIRSLCESQKVSFLVVVIVRFASSICWGKRESWTVLQQLKHWTGKTSSIDHFSPPLFTSSIQSVSWIFIANGNWKIENSYRKKQQQQQQHETWKCNWEIFKIRFCYLLTGSGWLVAWMEYGLFFLRADLETSTWSPHYPEHQIELSNYTSGQDKSIRERFSKESKTVCEILIFHSDKRKWKFQNQQQKKTKFVTLKDWEKRVS